MTQTAAVAVRTDPTTVTFGQAAAFAQQDAMELDERIVLLGQDIQAGFPFGATKGLVDQFGPDRVRNTPISEAATMGCGVGAALGGLRTVVEVDFSGFLLLGMDQLVNNAAKLRYMSGGQVHVPLVVRVGQGPLGSFAAQHSQSQHAFLSSVPGLTTLTPSTPQGVYDALRWALQQPDAVVVLEDMRLYRRTGLLRRGEPPASLGATVHRPGSDATVVTYGYGVTLATEAARVLAEDDIDVEILGLDSLSPLDIGAILESVRRTRRALVLTDDAPLFGVAATVASVIQTGAYGALEAPVASLTSRPVPTPYAPELERVVYPTADSVVSGVRALAAWGR